MAKLKKYKIWIETPESIRTYSYYAPDKNSALNELIQQMYQCKTTFDIISKANVLHVVEVIK